MRNDLADITLVIDRSGSMRTVQGDAEGGINQFIEDQKKQPGEANITIVQFDTAYDFVCNGVPIKDAPKYKMEPRGCTALYDAVGKAISEVGIRLSAMREEDRPGCVVFVIVTDGMENASKEFSAGQIRSMINEQRTKYNWKFTFLAEGESAFDDAEKIGILRMSTARYSNTGPQGPAGPYGVAGQCVSQLRSMSMSGSPTDEISYTDIQRSSIADSPQH